MEIQGRLEARNIDIHSQHGVLCGTSSLPPRSVTSSNTCFNSAVANTCDTQDVSNQHDDNSNHTRPRRTSLFRLPVENGSRSDCTPTNTRYAKVTADATTAEQHGVILDTELIASLGTQQSLKIPVRSRTSKKNNVAENEIPQIEQREVVLQRQLKFPLSILRLHHKDGAAKLSFVHRPNASVPGILNLIKDADKSHQNVFFSRCEGVSSPSRDEDRKPVNKLTERLDGCQGGSTSADFLNSDCSNNLENLKRTEQTLNDLNEWALISPPDTGSHHTDLDNAVSNKCNNKCDHGYTEIVGDIVVSQSHVNESSVLIPGSVGIVEAIDTSEINLYTMGLLDSSNSATDSLSHSVREPFSGTITINNQSLIVTIENGSLTLTSPPGGYIHREDIVKIKEHLVLTDQKDIVFLNYDSGTKSIGTISSLAVATSSYQKGPQSGLLVSDTELALVENSSLSELSTSLESYSTTKKEAEVFTAVVDSDVVGSSPRMEDCDREDFKPLSLSKSKKENVTSYSCPEPGCSCIFITRQKLKIHLLNHTEDPRPYQCSVDGCGWAFTTSYKLKRHLQSHNKQRPHICQFEGCGRSFTTVYNLKAHVKVHEQDNAFICEICSERFRSATRLTNHQRIHFEPHRPHKCEFPDCGKTFITFSALFSHNRTHFRETGQFLCNYPGCGKTYDKACRLKIHLRSHTGERPFVCDSEGCGWSFTSMSKLLRHKRKHDDDRRFVCTEEGCGKSFTRAEHLKGHSITHLGTKPFHCHAEGCSAKFSARSSLYIHSKKHKQEADSSRSRCPLTNCFKHFSSRTNLKNHMIKHHQLDADILNQIETQHTLTPSSELISSPQMSTVGHSMTGVDQLPSLDLGSMLSAVPDGTVCAAGMNSSSSTFTMDLSLVSPSILTIDPSSVGASNGLSTCSSFTNVHSPMADPLIVAASSDIRPVGNIISPKGTLNLDDVTPSPKALRNLTTLTTHDCAASLDPSLEHQLPSSHCMAQEPSSSLTNVPVPELLGLPSKVMEFGGLAGAGNMLGCVEVLGAQESGKVLTQLVYPSSSFSSKKDNPNSVSPSSYLEIIGSARTDYRAFQMAKRKKQRGPLNPSGAVNQGKNKVAKATIASTVLATSMVRYDDVARTANDGMAMRDSVPGTQYVQIQLLQDDPTSDGDLAFQLSSQPSSSHSQLTVDLPVNILQENSVMPEEDNGSDNTQFTGSTINLQDLV